MSKSFPRVAAIHHRRHEHESIRAQRFAVADVSDRFPGGRLRHAAQHGHLAGRDFLDGGHHCPLFLGAQRAVFPDRSQANDAVHTIPDQRIHHFLRGTDIEVFIARELGRRRRKHP